MEKMSISDFVDYFDFDITKDNEGFKLVDKQGANLGDIENEHFKSLSEVVERLDTYYNDYLYNSIETDFNIDTFDLKQALKEIDDSIETLKHYQKMLNIITEPDKYLYDNLKLKSLKDYGISL